MSGQPFGCTISSFFRLGTYKGLFRRTFPFLPIQSGCLNSVLTSQLDMGRGFQLLNAFDVGQELPRNYNQFVQFWTHLFSFGPSWIYAGVWSLHRSTSGSDITSSVLGEITTPATSAAVFYRRALSGPSALTVMSAFFNVPKPICFEKQDVLPRID